MIDEMSDDEIFHKIKMGPPWNYTNLNVKRIIKIGSKKLCPIIH